MNAHVRSNATLNLRTHSLIAFVLQPAEPLDQWLETLDSWLARSPNFFANKPIILDLAEIDISLKDYRDLLSQLARRHIRVMAVENSSRALVGPHLPPVVAGGRVIDLDKLQEPSAEAVEKAEPEAPAAPAPPPPPIRAEGLFHEGALRSGQRIVHLEGDVTVLGRVASGAEIVAGGSVHVYGAMQGRAFAGVAGPEGARILCREARAELLSIGGAFVTAEEMDPKLEGLPVEARLESGRVKLRALV